MYIVYTFRRARREDIGEPNASHPVRVFIGSKKTTGVIVASYYLLVLAATSGAEKSPRQPRKPLPQPTPPDALPPNEIRRENSERKARGRGPNQASTWNGVTARGNGLVPLRRQLLREVHTGSSSRCEGCTFVFFTEGADFIHLERS